jgi:hypothetical protein
MTLLLRSFPMLHYTVRTLSGYYAGRSVRTDRYGNEKPGKRIVTLSPALAEPIPADDTLAIREAIERLYRATGENPEQFQFKLIG